MIFKKKINILLFRKGFSFLFAFSFGPKHTLIKMHELVRKFPLSDSMTFFLEHSFLPLKALTIVSDLIHKYDDNG